MGSFSLHDLFSKLEVVTLLAAVKEDPLSTKLHPDTWICHWLDMRPCLPCKPPNHRWTNATNTQEFAINLTLFKAATQSVKHKSAFFDWQCHSLNLYCCAQQKKSCSKRAREGQRGHAQGANKWNINEAYRSEVSKRSYMMLLPCYGAKCKWEILHVFMWIFIFCVVTEHKPWIESWKLLW